MATFYWPGSMAWAVSWKNWNTAWLAAPKIAPLFPSRGDLCGVLEESLS